MKLAALDILVEFATRKVQACPVAEQVPIYQALSELLPSEAGRDKAREMARALSHAAALQLDFNENLFPSRDGHNGGDGAGKDGAQ